MAETQEQIAPSKGGDNEDLFAKIKDWFKESRDATSEWRKEAEEDYGFRDGHQWSSEDQDALKEQLRPIITFNRVGPVVDAVIGNEINNRQEIRYTPRELGDVKINEVLTSTAQWLREQSSAEDHETDAFADAITCGMGWVEGNMEYLDNPEGMFVETRIDPLEMYWDATARQSNLKDARYILRVREVNKEDAKLEYPDVDESDLHAAWASPDKGENEAEEFDLPQDSYKDKSLDQKVGKTIKIVECQWWERETFFTMLDPADGQIKDFDKAQMERINKRYKELGQPPAQYVKRPRKKFYRAFIGAKVLETEELQCGAFKYKCITGKRDQKKGTWYGVVRAMKDPQRWANKWLSQTLHIINSNAKGGVIIESDAVPNIRAFEEDWANPQAVTILNPGGLNKMREKVSLTFPSGMDKLMEFAIASIRDTSGINLEMLGLADREQAGVVEEQRKRAGITILARLFDSLRAFRKDMGKLMLFYIQNYISDGRLVKVVGEEGAQYVPLVRDAAAGSYDIIVDEAPVSPNQKDKVFGTLMQLAPGLSKMGITPPVATLDYLPLPSSLIDKWKQQIEESKNQPPPPDPRMVEIEQRGKIEQQKMAQDMEKAKMEASIDLQKHQMQIDADLRAKAMSLEAEAHHKAVQAEVNAKPATVVQFNAEDQLNSAGQAMVAAAQAVQQIAANAAASQQQNGEALAAAINGMNQSMQSVAAAMLVSKELVVDPKTGRKSVRPVIQ